MSDKDELAKLLFIADNQDSEDPDHEWEMTTRHDPDFTKYAFALADAILAAGYRKPRTITTREELDALPSGTAILDSDGNTNVLHDNGWVLPGSGGGYTSWAVAQALPVTVLYEPTP